MLDPWVKWLLGVERCAVVGTVDHTSPERLNPLETGPLPGPVRVRSERQEDGDRLIQITG